MVTREAREARATEYCGVVFRSKGEAVFARALDLAGFGWAYEPQEFSVGQWRPDFAVWRGYWEAIVELKPGEVTDTFRRELGERFDDFEALCYLAILNPWNRSVRSRIECYAGDEWVETTGPLANVLKHMKQAKSYRFDLAG